MIEKTVVDVSNQMNILESNEAGLLFIYQEEENMENFKRNVYDEMNGVRIIPIWHVYAFLLIYLFLLILKSRFILRDVIHKWLRSNSVYICFIAIHSLIIFDL